LYLKRVSDIRAKQSLFSYQTDLAVNIHMTVCLLISNQAQKTNENLQLTS